MPNIELMQMLKNILEVEKPIKMELIVKFQNEVWNSEITQDKDLVETLSEIAYDLDFYEPNEEWRMESLSYYGDDRLEEVLKTAIQKLQK